jgi:hypothetical protein
LIQAQILEKELVGQSVKTRADRLVMVLSMKAEKLDKAQTAYLNALKMTDEAEVRLQALRGLDRCYQNFSDSINNMVLPSDMTPDEQAAVRKELAALTGPIMDKQQENEAKIKSVASQNQLMAKDQKRLNFAEMKAEGTVMPAVQQLKVDELAYYVPTTRGGTWP